MRRPYRRHCPASFVPASGSGVSVVVNVFIADEQSDHIDVAVDVVGLRMLALEVLEAEGCPEETEVSVMLVGDDEMAGYNGRFMDRTGPTDVLSFPIETLTAGQPPLMQMAGPPPMLGDVLLAPSYIRRRAAELSIRFEDEMALLLVHGLLHLLGYDHQSEHDAARMESRERELLPHSPASRR